VKVVLQSKNQMMGLSNVNAYLGGVIQDSGWNLSAVIEYPLIIMLTKRMERKKVIRILLQDLL